jgi:hypothetical protein
MTSTALASVELPIRLDHETHGRHHLARLFLQPVHSIYHGQGSCSYPLSEFRDSSVARAVSSAQAADAVDASGIAPNQCCRNPNRRSSVGMALSPGSRHAKKALSRRQTGQAFRHGAGNCSTTSFKSW